MHRTPTISVARVLLASLAASFLASLDVSGGPAYAQRIIALARQVADPPAVRKAVSEFVLSMPAGRLTVLGGDGRMLADVTVKDPDWTSSPATVRGPALLAVAGAMRETLAPATGPQRSPAIDVQAVLRTVASLPVVNARILVLLGDPTYINDADQSFTQRSDGVWRYPTEPLIQLNWTASSVSCSALELRSLPVVVWSGIPDRRHEMIQTGVVARQVAAAHGVLAAWTTHPGLALGDGGMGSVPVTPWLAQTKPMLVGAPALVGGEALPADTPTPVVGAIRPDQVFTLPVQTIASMQDVVATTWTITLGWRADCDLDVGVAVSVGEPLNKVCTYSLTPLTATSGGVSVLMRYAADKRRGDPSGLELESITLSSNVAFNPLRLGLIPQVHYYSGSPTQVAWQMRVVPDGARCAYTSDGVLPAAGALSRVGR